MTYKLKTNLTYNSEKHNYIRDNVILPKARFSWNKTSSKRQQWEKNLLQYHAYLDIGAAATLRKTKARDDADYPGTAPIKIPLSKALGKIYITYLMEVYTATRPLFQFEGVGSEDVTPSEFLETVIEYQTTSPYIRDKMLLYHVFQDLVIYNQSCIRTGWTVKKALQTKMKPYLMGYDLSMVNLPFNLKASLPRFRTQEEVIAYEGNQVYLVDPPDMLPDPRFPLSAMNKGEFFGSLCTYSGGDVQEFGREKIFFNTEYINDLPATDPFKNRGQGGSSIGLDRDKIHNTNVNPNTGQGLEGVTGTPDKNWNNEVKLIDMEVKLIPAKYGLKWDGLSPAWHDRQQMVVFTLGNGQCILRCEPSTATHGKFSYTACELMSDGHTFMHRGMMEDTEGYQEELSWFHNNRMEFCRLVTNGEFIIDQSRYEMKDFEYTKQGGYIRVKPRFSGMPVADGIYQIQKTDTTINHIAMDSKVIYDMAKLLWGINDQMMGTLSSGRHTATESSAAMQMAASQLKCIAEVVDEYFFSNWSDILIQNTQQNLEEPQYYKIIGDYSARFEKKMKNGLLNVTPEDIMGRYNYKRRDGLIPINKLQEMAIWQQFYRDTASNPILLKIFNIVKIFGKMAEKAGIKNINEYVIDQNYWDKIMAVVPDGQVADGLQRGDMMPMGRPNNMAGFEQAGQQGVEGAMGSMGQGGGY